MTAATYFAICTSARKSLQIILGVNVTYSLTLFKIPSICRWKSLSCWELLLTSISAAVEACLLVEHRISLLGWVWVELCCVTKFLRSTVFPSHGKADHFQWTLECKCTWWEVEVAWKVGVFPGFLFGTDTIFSLQGQISSSKKRVKLLQ